MVLHRALSEGSRSSERLRISRDLHDTLGHHLTALSLQLDVASRMTEGKAGARQGTIWSMTLARRQGKPGPQLTPSTCGKMPDTSDARTAEEGLLGEAGPVADRTGLTGGVQHPHALAW